MTRPANITAVLTPSLQADLRLACELLDTAGHDALAERLLGLLEGNCHDFTIDTSIERRLNEAELNEYDSYYAHGLEMLKVDQDDDPADIVEAVDTWVDEWQDQRRDVAESELGPWDDNRSLIIYPTSFIKACLDDPDQDCTAMLAFNMQAEDRLVKAAPGSYTNVMHRVARIIPKR